jgi:FkbM family methyltransferase
MSSFLNYAWRNIVDSRTPAQVTLARRIAPGRKFGQLQLKACRYGWMLFDGPYIGKCFELYGEYSESEVALMRRFVRPGDTVIDIGANIGDLTLPLSQMVGDGGRVFAVESHARVFNVLCSNLALNGVDNVKPINAYVMSREAAAAPEVHTAFISERWSTQMLVLDDLGINHCRLLKIDVDGKEADILQSAQQLIARARPLLYVENDVRERSPALLRQMSELGYDLYWHGAPIFSPDNFFGNPDNYWAPENIFSAMVLGVPKESGLRVDDLPPVRNFDEWWNLAPAEQVPGP